MRSKSVGLEMRDAGVSVLYVLLLAWTAFGLIGMAGIVGADWPNWSSNMVLVCLTSRLRFAGPRWNESIGGFVIRLVALSTGLLGVTLAACLLAATVEKHATGVDFEPAQSLRALVISAVVLIAVAVGSGLASRPRLAHGSAVA